MPVPPTISRRIYSLISFFYSIFVLFFWFPALLAILWSYATYILAFLWLLQWQMMKDGSSARTPLSSAHSRQRPRTTVAKINTSHTPIHNHLDITYLLPSPECPDRSQKRILFGNEEKCSTVEIDIPIGVIGGFVTNGFRYRQFVIFTSIVGIQFAGHPAPLQLARPVGQIVLFISRFLSLSLFFSIFFKTIFDYLFIATLLKSCVLIWTIWMRLRV